MPARKSRPSYHPPDPFSVRWHTISSVATPSVDIMSSPDPLNDEINTPGPHLPSSQRITRSQRSSRFSSRSVSPRKQTFELEIGNNASPQRVYVTVAADDALQPSSNTRRRLFPSLSPAKTGLHRSQNTVTKTVPLRESIEEQVPLNDGTPTTPRRRGRPRKTNGTPMPSAAKRKRSVTPANRGTPTPKRSRTERPGQQPPPEASSQASIQGTPTPRKRGRPPKNRQLEPSSDVDLGSTASKRGRRRRQAMAPLEFAEIAEAAGEEALANDDDDQMDLIRAPSEPPQELIVVDPTPPPSSKADDDDDDNILGGDVNNADDDDVDDIWMATLSDEETPRAMRQQSVAADSITVATDEDIREQQGELGDLGEPEEPEEPQQSRIPALEADPEPEESPVRKSPAGATVRNEDTVAQEDFSMIFMDSIPELKASLSRSAGQPFGSEHSFGEETSYIINKTLEELRQNGESSQVIEEEQEEAVAKDSDAAASSSLPQQEDRASPPPRIALSPAVIRSALQSRTPRRNDISPLRRQLLRSASRLAFGIPRASEEEDDAEDEEYSMLEDAIARSTARNPFTARVNHDFSRDFEDSFSEVPDVILQAATPRPPAKRTENEDGLADVSREKNDDLPTGELSEVEEGEEEGRVEGEIENDAGRYEQQDEDNEDNEDIAEQEQESTVQGDDGNGESVRRTQRVSSNASWSIRSDASRLPTPDDTPPSHEEANQIHVTVLEKIVTSQAALASSSRSPAVVAAQSRNLRPQIPQIIEPAESVREPLITTEKRANSMERTPVHQISSPAQEPGSLAPENVPERGRRPTLSPIVRAGLALQNITSDPPSPELQEPHLRSPFRSSTNKDKGLGEKNISGPRASPANPQRPFSFPPAKLPTQQAPFHQLDHDPLSSVPASRAIDPSDFARSLRRSILRSPDNGRPRSRESVANSLRVTPPGDEMSWVAEAGPISPRLRGDNTLQEVYPRATQTQSSPTERAQTRPANAPLEDNRPEDENGLGDEEIDDPQGSDGENDDDDETDIWEVEAQREMPKSARQQPFGRSLAAGRRRSGMPSPWTRQAPVVQAPVSAPQDVPAAVGNGEEVDEESMVTQKQAAEKDASAPEPVSEKKRNFDLASFFSSPAAIPGILAAKSMSIFGTRQANPDEGADAAPATLPTNSLFPQSRRQQQQPQISVSSQRKAVPPVSGRQLDGEGEEEEEEEEEDDQQPLDLPNSPQETPSLLGLPIQAMKQQFAPRPRQPDRPSFFHSPTKQSAAAPSMTPPRMQLTRGDIQRWQHEAESAGVQDPPSGSTRPRPLLRPLPARNASPTKSSLRSPLKGRTPGRVVEFTSSVLSPADQARSRAERRMSHTSSHVQPTPPAAAAVFAGVSRPPPPPQLRVENERESEVVNDVVMTDVASSTLEKEDEPIPEPALSKTVWTRQHWLLLDEMVQQRRQGRFDADYEKRAEKLLGKTVKSQGEAMTLERWHLDCVDAFKAEVGGWDESVLAKRLFALLLGEERRKRGEVTERSTRVMFH